MAHPKLLYRLYCEESIVVINKMCDVNTIKNGGFMWIEVCVLFTIFTWLNGAACYELSLQKTAATIQGFLY